MPLILHAHPLSSFCWKVLIPLYENEVDFTLQLLDLGDPEAYAAFVALWPIGKMPVLQDGGRTLVESSLIIEYLDLHHPGAVRFLPADPDAALEVRLMDRVFDQYVMAPMQRIVGERLRPTDRRDPLGVEQARQQLAVSYEWLEMRLTGRWATGEAFTMADCAAMPALHYANRVLPFGDRPALSAYLDRLEARPSVSRVLAEAAPWAHLFPTE